MNRRLQITCVIFSAMVSTVPAEDGLADRREIIVRKMLDRRERVESGIVEITGTKVIVGEGVPEVRGHVKGLSKFDRKSNRLFYESEELSGVVVVVPGKRPTQPVDPADTQSTQSIVKFKLCRTKDFDVDWHQLNKDTYSEIQIRTSGAGVRHARAREIGERVIDPMAFGAIAPSDFLKGASLTEAYHKVLEMRVEAIEEAADRITMRLNDRGLVYVMVIDPRTWTPIEFSYRSNDWYFSSTVEWETVDDNSVPVRFHMKSGVDDVEDVQFQLKAKWSSINAAGGESFDYQQWTGIPAGVAVLDVRGPKPVRVGIWRRDGLVEEVNDKPDATARTGPPTGSGGWRSTLIVVNILGLIAIGILLLTRGRRRAGHGS